MYKYGEFFPIEISPFAYNETIAGEMFPLDKKKVLELGFKWKEAEERQYVPTKKVNEISDQIQEVSDSVVNEVLECAHQGGCQDQCTSVFRIMPEELAFYRNLKIPLPRLCPSCRHYQRVKQRNPIRLWHRKCQCAGAASENQIYKNTAEHSHKETHCPNEFETSYAPDRPEIVYCEQCYQAEVV